MLRILLAFLFVAGSLTAEEGMKYRIKLMDDTNKEVGEMLILSDTLKINQVGEQEYTKTLHDPIKFRMVNAGELQAFMQFNKSIFLVNRHNIPDFGLAGRPCYLFPSVEKSPDGAMVITEGNSVELDVSLGEFEDSARDNTLHVRIMLSGYVIDERKIKSVKGNGEIKININR